MPIPGPEPTPEPTPTPSPSVGDASCEHIITNSWSDGFQGTIRITNNSNNTVNGWAVNWTYSDGTSINQSWNAQVSGNGSYTASNTDWNATIEPSQTVEFGFTAQGEGSTPAITGDICSNGTQITIPTQETQEGYFPNQWFQGF
jgi:cellulase/cellobiase CelA1